MKALTEKLLHYSTLIGVTVIAAWVMWRMTSKNEVHNQHEKLIRPKSAVAAPKAPVMIESVEVKQCEITAAYSGKIHPWETHRVGFEAAGRVTELGTNSSGQSLDDGDEVRAGQILAKLDDRVFRARKSETSARVEQTTSDLRRAQTIRQTNPSAVSDSELHNLVTELALARAQYDIALKNLEDATLTSPVDATISLRHINPGEYVGGNQTAFELVENKEVLLLVDVPESQVRDLESRMRTIKKNIKQNASQAFPGIEDPDRTFRAYVELAGRDRLGNAWPPLQGDVYRIAEVADSRTGLFAVEIRLANEERFLRPGMVATARIVLARTAGYEIPEAAIIVRKNQAYLFSVEKEPADMEVLYWNLGKTSVHRAKRIELDTWIEQGPNIIIPASEANIESVVVRGQHRLADSQLVRVINWPTNIAIETAKFSSSRDKPLKTRLNHAHQTK